MNLIVKGVEIMRLGLKKDEISYQTIKSRSLGGR